MPDTTHFRDQLCRLCGRPLGRRKEAHHVVPKSKGGRETTLLHPICHKKIQTVFTNTELANLKGNMESLKQHPDIQRFIRWVAKRPPDFHAPTRS